MVEENQKPVMVDQDVQSIPEEIKQAINTLPEGSRQVVTQFIVQQRTESFSGPLPSPRVMREYNEILPGAAERTFIMAEKEQTHRHELDDKIVKGAQTLDTRGQWFGAVLVLVLAALAFYLGINGHDWLAGAVFTTTIVSVAVVFVLHLIPSKK